MVRDQIIKAYYQTEYSPAVNKELADKFQVTERYVRRVYKDFIRPKREEGLHEKPFVVSNKVESDYNLDEILDAAEAYKQALNRTKNTQGTYLKMSLNVNTPICVVGIGDTQLGSYGTDLGLFKEITDEILNTPDLYVILLGDLTQMAVKFRGVLEMMDNLIPPKVQFKLLEDWIKKIKHKVICSVWENHAQMREENGIGFSPTAEMLAEHTAHFNGIGHVDLTVGSQEYKIAVSHFFRGRSMYNPVHAQMKYTKWEGQDREIVMAGDSHVPGVCSYFDGGVKRLAINCGSIQTESGYAQRFFSIKTHPLFPCVVLHHEKKMFQGLDSVANWIKIKNTFN
jgi:hypothetical protein